MLVVTGVGSGDTAMLGLGEGEAAGTLAGALRQLNHNAGPPTHKRVMQAARVIVAQGGSRSKNPLPPSPLPGSLPLAAAPFRAASCAAVAPAARMPEVEATP